MANELEWIERSVDPKDIETLIMSGFGRKDGAERGVLQRHAGSTGSSNATPTRTGDTATAIATATATATAMRMEDVAVMAVTAATGAIVDVGTAPRARPAGKKGTAPDEEDDKKTSRPGCCYREGPCKASGCLNSPSATSMSTTALVSSSGCRRAERSTAC